MIKETTTSLPTNYEQVPLFDVNGNFIRMVRNPKPFIKTK